MSTTHTTETNQFFEGFSWALLTAFGEPLAACRFERGDTLYDTRRAYQGKWGDALPLIRYSLQVKSPLPGPVTKAEKGRPTKGDKKEESLFAHNWNETVIFSFTDHKKNETREITTTQGRLYSLLWKGDLSYLDRDSPTPPVPTLAMQILRDLPNTIRHLREKVLNGAKNAIVFLMPYDATRQLLRTKFRKVQQSLGAFKGGVDFVPPEEAGLTSDAGFAPTVRIACFLCDEASQAIVEKALKQALYQPAKDKKTEKDRFRIAAHGYVSII